LHAALVKFYEDVTISEKNNKKTPEIPRYIGECIMHIATNLSGKINFVMYSFREELVGDAIEKMVEAVHLHKYDPNLSKNPFAYFTQIAWNCFLQRIQKERIEAYVKHKNIENLIMHATDENIESLLDNDEHNKVINNFEKPKEKNNYAKHKNLSYEKNRKRRNTINTTES